MTHKKKQNPEELKEEYIDIINVIDWHSLNLSELHSICRVLKIAGERLKNEDRDICRGGQKKKKNKI